MMKLGDVLRCDGGVVEEQTMWCLLLLSLLEKDVCCIVYYQFLYCRRSDVADMIPQKILHGCEYQGHE